MCKDRWWPARTKLGADRKGRIGVRQILRDLKVPQDDSSGVDTRRFAGYLRPPAPVPSPVEWNGEGVRLGTKGGQGVRYATGNFTPSASRYPHSRSSTMGLSGAGEVQAVRLCRWATTRSRAI